VRSWESGNLGICIWESRIKEFGNLGMWECWDVGIWNSANLGICESGNMGFDNFGIRELGNLIICTLNI